MRKQKKTNTNTLMRKSKLSATPEKKNRETVNEKQNAGN